MTRKKAAPDCSTSRKVSVQCFVATLNRNVKKQKRDVRKILRVNSLGNVEAEMIDFDIRARFLK